MSTPVVVCGTQPELSPVSSVPQPLAQLSLTRPGPSWDKGASLQLLSVELGALCVYVFVRMYIATRAFLTPPWVWHPRATSPGQESQELARGTSANLQANGASPDKQAEHGPGQTSDHSIAPATIRLQVRLVPVCCGLRPPRSSCPMLSFCLSVCQSWRRGLCVLRAWVTV